MNRVILIGNVGKDAEKRGVVVSFSLATSAGKDKTDWHTIKAFGKTAELCESIRKGAKVAIEGRLTYNTFEKDGQKRVFAEVIADRVEFLSPKVQAEKPAQTAASDIDDIFG